MIVVSDTSAITSLLQIGRAEILRQIYGEILIPPAVQRELAEWHPVLPSFIRVVPAVNLAECRRLKILLDDGEAEAIVLAKEIKADGLLMDDADGRRVALAEGLKVIGLLGVLLKAKAQGIVPSVGELMDALESKAGFFVADSIKETILRAAGEL